MEQTRSIHVRVEVDTNKRTYILDEECDSLADLAERVEEWVDDFSDDGDGRPPAYAEMVLGGTGAATVAEGMHVRVTGLLSAPDGVDLVVESSEEREDGTRLIRFQPVVLSAP